MFLLEEPSMKAALEGLLPRVLPADVRWHLVPHEGKNDLERSIPRKLRGWRTPETCFVVVRDQDSADCGDVKARLVDLCHHGHRPDSLVRVVCRELEAWFFGDLIALDEALGTQLAGREAQVRLRDPDAMHKPSAYLQELVPGYQKVAGARAMGRALDPDRNRSHSFQVFLAGVLRLAREGCQA